MDKVRRYITNFFLAVSILLALPSVFLSNFSAILPFKLTTGETFMKLMIGQVRGGLGHLGSLVECAGV